MADSHESVDLGESVNSGNSCEYDDCCDLRIVVNLLIMNKSGGHCRI